MQIRLEFCFLHLIQQVLLWFIHQRICYHARLAQVSLDARCITYECVPFTKRRVTFRKTTGHFSQNDGSLITKRRMSFSEQTEVEKPLTKEKEKSVDRVCKKTFNNLLSRVRARAHHRSFYFFAVTSVTANVYFTGFQ